MYLSVCLFISLSVCPPVVWLMTSNCASFGHCRSSVMMSQLLEVQRSYSDLTGNLGDRHTHQLLNVRGNQRWSDITTEFVWDLEAETRVWTQPPIRPKNRFRGTFSQTKAVLLFPLLTLILQHFLILCKNVKIFQMVRMFQQLFSDEFKRNHQLWVCGCLLSEGCRVILLFEDSMVPEFLLLFISKGLLHKKCQTLDKISILFADLFANCLQN